LVNMIMMQLELADMATRAPGSPAPSPDV